MRTIGTESLLKRALVVIPEPFIFERTSGLAAYFTIGGNMNRFALLLLLLILAPWTQAFGQDSARRAACVLQKQDANDATPTGAAKPSGTTKRRVRVDKPFPEC